MQMSITIKIADHIKKRGTNAEGVMCIRHNNYESYHKRIVIKYVEQTTVKQQESA
jgi:hypothetical protein